MRRLGIVLALFAISTLCGPVLAQSSVPTAEEKAAARTLGVEGLEALGKQQYDVALDAFERALGLFDFPTLRLGRARALAGLSRFVEASEEYRTLLNSDLDDSEQLRRVAQDAERELDEVKAKIGYVTLQVTPRDAEVMLDGKKLAPGMFGVPVPLNPGQHELSAKRDGHGAFEQRVHVESGKAETMTVTLVPSAAPPPEAPPEPDSEAGPLSESNPTTKPQRDVREDDSSASIGAGTYVAGGATLVLTGAAVITGIFALQRRRDFNRINNADTDVDEKLGKRDEAVSMAWISTGLSAGALAGAALTTYLLFDSDDELETALYTDGKGAWFSASFAF
jgi:tetratricopeptide (TPR) repeat protein